MELREKSQFSTVSIKSDTSIVSCRLVEVGYGKVNKAHTKSNKREGSQP